MTAVEDWFETVSWFTVETTDCCDQVQFDISSSSLPYVTTGFKKQVVYLQDPACAFRLAWSDYRTSRGAQFTKLLPVRGWTSE